MITIRIQGDRGLVQSDQLLKDCWVDARNVTSEDLARLEREFGIHQELLTRYHGY